MNKATVLATLRAHQKEIQEAGILSLSLFGSFARGDETVDSDVDLLAEFDRQKIRNALQLVHLQDMLVATLQNPVDLSSMSWLKQRVRKQAEREVILVF